MISHKESGDESPSFKCLTVSAAATKEPESSAGASAKAARRCLPGSAASRCGGNAAGSAEALALLRECALALAMLEARLLGDLELVSLPIATML